MNAKELAERIVALVAYLDHEAPAPETELQNPKRQPDPVDEVERMLLDWQENAGRERERELQQCQEAVIRWRSLYDSSMQTIQRAMAQLDD